MITKFKIARTKKEFKMEIPNIPQIGDKVTLHDPKPVTYNVKSIEHEIKDGFYNANVTLSLVKVKKKS